MKTHGYRFGTHDESYDDADVPGDEDHLEAFTSSARRQIQPWLSAVFQSETSIFCSEAGSPLPSARWPARPLRRWRRSRWERRTTMRLGHMLGQALNTGRGQPNIEDQFRSALALMEGLNITGDNASATAIKTALDVQLGQFLRSLLATEAGIAAATTPERRALLQPITCSHS